jgi:Uma2 family endonuclease
MATVAEIASKPSQALNAPFELTIDVFSQMVETGLIPHDRRVYLQDGRLFEKMAKTKPHGFVGAAITMSLAPRLPSGWALWPESTIVLDDHNAPLPDFAVIRGASPLDFAKLDRYPDPRDIGLLIEISITSLRTDLTTTLEQYARALIPMYWVIDVRGRRILIHSEPPRRRWTRRVWPCRDLSLGPGSPLGARRPGSGAHPLRRATPLRAPQPGRWHTPRVEL